MNEKSEESLSNYKRVEFSLHTNRFEINVNNLAQLPLTVLKAPKVLEDGQVDRGILICGDSIVDDLVEYMPEIKKNWFVVSTTQSHIIPNSLRPDLHLFSNVDGNEQYEKNTTKEIPYANLGDGGHFVDPEVFFPDESVKKVIDAIYVSKWSDTKRVELFVQAAEKLHDKKFVLVGIPMSSERKRVKSLEYREAILNYIKTHKISNIQIIEPGDSSHTNSDGSIVPGNLSKDEMRLLFQSSRSIILTAKEMEGINRSICEGLCCDVPVIMTSDMIGGTPRLVTSETGFFAEPNGQSIAMAIEKAIKERRKLHPREAFMNKYGVKKTNDQLRKIIKEISKGQNSQISVEKMRNYGGDLWSNDFYSMIAKPEIRDKYLESLRPNSK